MKNFILSAAFILGALSVNASNSLNTDFNTPPETIVLDGCTTTTVTETTTNPDGSSRTITVSVEVCD
jgi:hypothetical protein